MLFACLNVRLGRILLSLAIVIVHILSLSPTAMASIHTYPESDTRIMYRSRLSVQDNRDQAWQIILFKHQQAGQIQDFNLRLVGFPGQISIQHPAPLRIQDSHDHDWMALDQTQEDPQLETVQTSVGQYDLMPIMKDLDRAERLELKLTLTGEEFRTLVVPQFMVREWLALKEMSDGL